MALHSRRRPFAVVSRWSRTAIVEGPETSDTIVEFWSSPGQQARRYGNSPLPELKSRASRLTVGCEALEASYHLDERQDEQKNRHEHDRSGDRSDEEYGEGTL